MPERVTGSQAVDRALSLLRLFDERTDELTIAQAAAQLGVHRSTASRFLSSLERHGLLELHDDREVVYIDQASRPGVTVNADWVGYRQPLTAGASGFLLLAHQPQEVIDELVAKANGDGPDLPSELELAAIRRRGYLVRTSDSDDGGSAGAAAAVRDHRGTTVAALSVWGPRHRVEPRLESEVVPAVLRAAARVSEGLGYRAA